MIYNILLARRAILEHKALTDEPLIGPGCRHFDPKLNPRLSSGKKIAKKKNYKKEKNHVNLGKTNLSKV